MKYQNILIKDISAHIRLITLNRPAQLNALNKKTIEELHEALKKADNDGAIRVVILMGSGEKAFAAGADIKEFMNFTPEEGRKLSEDGHKLLFDFIENMKSPVIAAINGYALGGGLELALASHIRIASTNAKLGLPEVALGVIPGYGGTQRLAHLIGKGRAIEMILTARPVDAQKALTYGLVSEVVPFDKLLDKAVEYAGYILKNSPQAIGLAIEAVNAAFMNTGLKKENELFGKAFSTSDFKEGTKAFIERRKPGYSVD